MGKGNKGSAQRKWPFITPPYLSQPENCHSLVFPSLAAISSAQFSHSVMSSSLWPCGLPHARPPCPSPTPGACSNSCTISSSVTPFSSCLQAFPASGSFLMSQFFTSVAKVLEFQLQHQSFQWIFRTDILKVGLVWSPFSPRDPQESSPAPQFKSINALALSFLYRPILTSIHDYWKNHYLIGKCKLKQ